MDAKFMADAEKEVEEERADHAAFDAEQEQRREAATVVDESDNDFEWDWNGPNPEEKAAEQRAILASFDLLKKTEENDCAREEANKEQRRRVVDICIQRAQIEEAVRRLFAKERQRLLQDVADFRAFLAGLQRDIGVVAEKRMREGGDDRAGPSSTPKDDE
jgi:hypothetical protein